MSGLITGPTARAPLVSVSLQGIVYGFSTCMFGMTVWVLTIQRKGRANRAMLAISSFMWIIDTLRIVIDMTDLVDAFVNHLHDGPGDSGPEAFISAFSRPISLVDNGIYCLQTLIGDAVVIYRCYIVWQSVWMIVIPSLAWMGSLGSIIFVMYSFAKGIVTGQRIVLVYSFTLAANLTATLALAYRIWKVDKEARHLRDSSNTLRPVLLTIIESGAIYTALLIFALITVTHALEVEYVVNSIMPAMIAITFDMIFIRIGIAQNARSGYRASGTFPLSTIMFKENEVDNIKKDYSTNELTSGMAFAVSEDTTTTPIKFHHTVLSPFFREISQKKPRTAGIWSLVVDVSIVNKRQPYERPEFSAARIKHASLRDSSPVRTHGVFSPPLAAVVFELLSLSGTTSLQLPARRCLCTLRFLLKAAFSLLADLCTYLWFKRFETSDILHVSILLGLPPAIPVAFLRTHLESTLLAGLVAYSTFYVSLLLSILVYRISPLHPLWSYPGPVLCKISKLWLVYVASDGKLHMYYYKVHKKYGPIVRIGPNELSVVDTALLPSILGSDGMPKGPLWEGRRISGKRGAGAKNVKGNLIGARNKQQHTEARRVWNRAFTSASVKRYEPIVIRRASQLVDALKKRAGNEEVDLSQWLSYFSFDFMGDFVFGGPFDLLRDGDKNDLVGMMENGLYLPALTQHVPWCIEALLTLPFLGKHMKGLGEFAFQQITRRMKEGSVHDDLFYHLNDEGRGDTSSGSPPLPVLMSNAVTAIIAGSDTTAAALSNTFYLMLSHPSCYRRLQIEVDAAFPPGRGEPTDSAKLAQMEYLNAVINESLRLYPPVRTSLQRAPQMGTGGHMLGSTMFIPEGTAIYAPPYVYHHDPRYFSRPEDFFPERWLSKNGEDNTFDPSAFIPFSMGPANCVGRPLALIEMRMVIAYILHAFELRFANGYDPASYEKHLQDLFVTHRGPLPVTLIARAAN
ncbi:uncharacterized protein FIBRA_06839 [Fibroporia radiculosa]|uniref:Cytochrome P450 n=1 Tax=Fibroporia radiculosa TaxID=599839 RepID=J4GTN6_9APHY|nr:uncharacterized protein FIBRA_06839 [Fibroporia radiculosa]CCM04655.1 predicted protein [Fibroporia radiculosa]